MKAPITWVLLANSQRAFVVENRGVSKGLSIVTGSDRTADAATEFADRAGSVRLGDSYQQADPKAQAEAQFARQLSQDMQNALRKGRFDRLIVCAAPHMLGSLRKEFPDSISVLLHAEIAKDLTDEPTGKLPDHLCDVIAV